MKKLLSIACVCGICALLTGCEVSFTKSPGSVSIPGTTLGVSTDAGMWVIEYHADGDALSYAVISGPSPGSAQGHVRSGGDSSGQVYAKLHKPDGTEVPILGSGRVFHVSGTNVNEAPHPITAPTFRAFLDSRPPDYSLAALLKFVGTQK